MTKPGQGPHSPVAEDRVADAVEGSWVDTVAPFRARPYLRLSRVDRPIGTWLLLLPCWWGLLLAMAASPERIRFEDLWILVGCAIGAVAMRGAGCTWNDIVDRDLDAQVKRTMSRPLPAGAVTVRQAWCWIAIQVGVGFAILMTLNLTAIVLGVLSLLPVVAYPFAKRFTWWPQLALGIAFNWGALLAWAAHAGSLSAAAFLLYLAGILWTLFYDTIYAHQDREDDALVGIRSTARLLGSSTKRWLSGFAAGATTLMVAAILTALPVDDRPFAVLVCLIGAAGFAAHLGWQTTRLDMDDGSRCLRLFRSNRDTGLLPSVSFVVAALAGLS